MHRGFPTYLGLAGFYNVEQYQETQSHGKTKVTYDPYWCLTIAVTLPDGCTTHSLDIDYRSFLPAAIEDANRNIQEARYSAFGEPLVTSFHGTELGEPVGFESSGDLTSPLKTATQPSPLPIRKRHRPFRQRRFLGHLQLDGSHLPNSTAIPRMAGLGQNRRLSYCPAGTSATGPGEHLADVWKSPTRTRRSSRHRSTRHSVSRCTPLPCWLTAIPVIPRCKSG